MATATAVTDAAASADAQLLLLTNLYIAATAIETKLPNQCAKEQIGNWRRAFDEDISAEWRSGET